MPAFTCRTCGVQYPDAPTPPSECRVCRDPRQYVGWQGQLWTTREELAQEGHTTELREEEPGLWGIGVTPSFAIGQRALLVQTAEGNLLWDIPGFIDDAAVQAVRELGGVAAISASHPHFYGVMVEWAHAFEAPIYLPEDDREWVCRPDPAYRFYRGELQLLPGVRLVQCGGHFPGSAVAWWGEGAEGRGVLCSGDTIAVVQDRDWVSVMWSYPNLIPLSPAVVERVVGAVDHLPYDRIYGGWWGKVMRSGARQKVAASVARYRRMVAGG